MSYTYYSIQNMYGIPYKDNQKYVGMELELELNYCDDDFDSDYWSPSDFGCEDYAEVTGDCSLEDGLEFVTNPCTVDYHCNTDHLYDLLKAVQKQGFTHIANNTGLHIHVSSDYLTEKEIDFILLFVLLQKEYMCNFARRYNSEYAKFITPNVVNTNVYKGAILDGSKGYAVTHVTDYDTIEFRLFKATFDEDLIKAYMIFCNDLCLYAKTLNLPEEEKLITLCEEGFYNEPFLYYLKSRSKELSHINYTRVIKEVKEHLCQHLN